MAVEIVATALEIVAVEIVALVAAWEIKTAAAAGSATTMKPAPSKKAVAKPRPRAPHLIIEASMIKRKRGPGRGDAAPSTLAGARASPSPKPFARRRAQGPTVVARPVVRRLTTRPAPGLAPRVLRAPTGRASITRPRITRFACARPAPLAAGRADRVGVATRASVTARAPVARKASIEGPLDARAPSLETPALAKRRAMPPNTTATESDTTTPPTTVTRPGMAASTTPVASPATCTRTATVVGP